MEDVEINDAGVRDEEIKPERQRWFSKGSHGETIFCISWSRRVENDSLFSSTFMEASIPRVVGMTQLPPTPPPHFLLAFSECVAVRPETQAWPMAAKWLQTVSAVVVFFFPVLYRALLHVHRPL